MVQEPICCRCGSGLVLDDHKQSWVTSPPKLWATKMILRSSCDGTQHDYGCECMVLKNTTSQHYIPLKANEKVSIDDQDSTHIYRPLSLKEYRNKIGV